MSALQGQTLAVRLLLELGLLAALAAAVSGGIVFGILALATSLLDAKQEHAVRSPSPW